MRALAVATASFAAQRSAEIVQRLGSSSGALGVRRQESRAPFGAGSGRTVRIAAAEAADVPEAASGLADARPIAWRARRVRVDARRCAVAPRALRRQGRGCGAPCATGCVKVQSCHRNAGRQKC
jgi:hypothetical protein